MGEERTLDRRRAAGRASVVVATLMWAMLGVQGVVQTTAARAANLPDGRAFELVTPPDTNGNEAYQSVGGGATAVLSDDAIVFGGGTNPDGPSGSGASPYYVATRTPSGWVSGSLLPAQINPNQKTTLLDATPSLSASVFLTGQSASFSAPLPSQEVPASLVYRDQTGAFSTIESIPYSAALAGASATYAGMSADGQTVAYTATVTPAGEPAPGGSQVYAWHPGGSPESIEGEPGDALAGCGASAVSGAPNDVSADGSTVFVASGSGGGSGCPTNSQVYASVDGQSELISAPTDGTADPLSSAAGATFFGASPDGQTAYFTSDQPLTASAGNATSDELYEWTAGSATTPARVVCISCAATNDQGLPGNNPVPVVSSQGDYVYFTGLNPGNGGPDGLFVEHDGSVEMIDSDSAGYELDPSNTQLSPAGNVIVYSPDDNNGSLGYSLYRAAVNGDAVSAPECITCGVNGLAGLGLMTIAGDGLSGTGYRGASTMLGGGDDAISADGDTVVFETTNALGDADAGSGFQVYEWTPAAGDQLLANAFSGATTGDAVITPDGQDIIFYSDESLTSDDPQPGAAALYDARVGGGFPASMSVPACSGDSCQGASPTGSSPVVTSTSGCCGDVRPTRVALSLRVPSNGALRAAARSGRLLVRLDVRGSGRLMVRLLGVLQGRRQTVVADAHRRVAAAHGRVVAVTLELSSAARRALAVHGKLMLTLSASLPGTRPREVRLTLERMRHSAQGTGGRS